LHASLARTSKAAWIARWSHNVQLIRSTQSSESSVRSDDKKCSNWNTGTAHRDNDLRATVCLCTLKRCASDVTASGRDPHARWLLPLGAAVAVLTVCRSRISPITRWSSSADKAKAAMPPTSKRHSVFPHAAVVNSPNAAEAAAVIG